MNLCARLLRRLVIGNCRPTEIDRCFGDRLFDAWRTLVPFRARDHRRLHFEHFASDDRMRIFHVHIYLPLEP